MIEHGVVTDQIDIQQIYDARRTIEARTAALAALRHTQAEGRTILDHAHAMQEALARPDSVMEHDIPFPLAIANPARTPVFVLIFRPFKGVMRQPWPARKTVGWGKKV